LANTSLTAAVQNPDGLLLTALGQCQDLLPQALLLCPLHFSRISPPKHCGGFQVVDQR
jgi:hypothetical protein